MKKLRILLCAIGVLLTLFATAQSNKVTKAQKKAEKKKTEQLDNQQKSELKARKQHMKNQTPEVRKRMKKHRKGDIHVSSYSKRPGFFKRLFHRKEH